VNAGPRSGGSSNRFVPRIVGRSAGWLTEGHQFGEAASRKVREFFARGEFLSGGSSEDVVRVTEVLEPLILRNRRDIDAAFDVLVGMDLESERLSELNEQE
jgi:hypothetical protein